MLPLKRQFCDSEIVIIRNFVIVSSVGIKRVVYTNNVSDTIMKFHKRT